MLDRLIQYAEAHNLGAEPGFEPKIVKWAIQLDSAGGFLGVVELGEVSDKRNPGRRFPKCPALTQPEMKGGAKSHFLIYTAAVVALFGDKSSEAKVREKHDYFIGLLSAAAAEIEPASAALKKDLAAAARALDDPAVLERLGQSLEECKAKPTDQVTPRVDGRYLIESAAWHEWWRRFRSSLQAEREKQKPKGKNARNPLSRCFATGDLVEPAATHPKIKGLSDVGGLPTHDVLISFKPESFRSYGFEQSANAAVSEVSAWTYGAALNHLIRRQGRRLAANKSGQGVKVVHWFRDKAPEDDPLPWLCDPPGGDADEIGARRRADQLLKSIRAGKRPDLAANRYYALTLSANSGRVMTRDWMEGPFEELVARVHSWFDDLAIVARDGGRWAREPKFAAVLGAAVRKLTDLDSPFVARMWRCAVRGEPLPRAALAKTLARVRVDILTDSPFNHARMGLLRAYNLRNLRTQGDDAMSKQLKPGLNPEHPEAAYHCGRLMAVLAALQRSALGDVGAGVVQRYYGAASSTPALVFGRLIRSGQHHLSKLSPGLAHWYDGRLASIWEGMPDRLPNTLSLEEQSLFALGYYQQIAELRNKKHSDDADDDANDDANTEEDDNE